MGKKPKYVLKNFFSSFGAAMHLLERAKGNNSYIEKICLCASIIDGLLRVSLIMEEQLRNNTNSVNCTYLFQSDKDKPILERKIYKLSLGKKTITKQLFTQLERLYELRNKIIHRYIISDIKTIEVKKISDRYYKMMDKIADRYRKYEEMQKTKQIGLSTQFIANPTKNQMANEILEKHKGLYKKASFTS
jgi:hypothetical protein